MCVQVSPFAIRRNNHSTVSELYANTEAKSNLKEKTKWTKAKNIAFRPRGLAAVTSQDPGRPRSPS